MNKIIVFLLLFYTLSASAQCRLNQYRWDCQIAAQYQHASKYYSSIVQCGGLTLHVSPSDYDIFVKNVRANIATSVKMNGQYFDGPCFPISR